jgi:hypothetical protein
LRRDNYSSILLSRVCMKSGLLRELTFDDSGLVRVELQQLYKERTKGVYYVGLSHNVVSSTPCHELGCTGF